MILSLSKRKEKGRKEGKQKKEKGKEGKRKKGKEKWGKGRKRGKKKEEDGFWLTQKNKLKPFLGKNHIFSPGAGVCILQNTKAGGGGNGAGGKKEK